MKENRDMKKLKENPDLENFLQSLNLNTKIT